MRVGIAYSLAPAPEDRPPDGPEDRYEEFDRPETVDAIADVIRAEGHDVVRLGDGREFLSRVLADPPDFVFNIAEGDGVGRCREARVPAVLELMGIPYSGSDPLTLAATLDKDVARRLVGGSKPRGQLLLAPAPDARSAPRFLAGLWVELFFDEPEMWADPDLERTPLILKPAFEGSSKGIRDGGIVRSGPELVDRYRALRAAYRQPILVEEFIAGDEVTVGIVGNWLTEPELDGEVLGAMRIVPNDADADFVYSLDVKRDWRSRVTYECPASLPGLAVGKTLVAARMAYMDLGCRDCARIDFRVREGVPYFIEANPLPGLAPTTSDLVILAEGHGIGHADLIRRIFRAALARVGLS